MGHPRSPNWTLDFEPAFSPRFSPTLSPRSFFPTGQRFPISNHVTSGWMSPRSNFTPWSAVSHTGSSSGHVIALDQSGLQKHFSVLVKTNLIKNIIFISCCFQNHIKSIYGPYMGHPRSRNWTLDFEPAFSPRFSPTLSPRSFFPTGQRFPISNHMTSGWMSPRSNFDHWSAVSHTGSSSGHVIALGQSGARKYPIRAPFTTRVAQ